MRRPRYTYLHGTMVDTADPNKDRPQDRRQVSQFSTPILFSKLSHSISPVDQTTHLLHFRRAELSGNDVHAANHRRNVEKGRTVHFVGSIWRGNEKEAASLHTLPLYSPHSIPPIVFPTWHHAPIVPTCQPASCFSSNLTSSSPSSPAAASARASISSAMATAR